MDNTSNINNVEKKQERVVKNLVKGREYANQLQALLQKPYGEKCEGFADLAEELSDKVLKSFSDTLALMMIHQIGPADPDSGDPKTTPFPTKDRRGGYKRRRAADSYVRVSPTIGDGYTWRKYGQKDIHNSKFPRCYYRCTHKYDQGCKTIKQVQKIVAEDQSIMFQTTYFGQHTCKNHSTTQQRSQIISHFDDESNHNMLSFEGNKIASSSGKYYAVPSVKQESFYKEETQSDLSENKSSIYSSVWQDLVASSTCSQEPILDYSPKVGSYHHDQEVVSSVYSTTSLLDLDHMKSLSMEFAGIDNLQD